MKDDQFINRLNMEEIREPVSCWRADQSALKNQGVLEHDHDEMQIVCIKKGEIVLEIQGNEVTVNQGQALFINSNIPHSVVRFNRETTEVQGIYIDKNLFFENIGRYDRELLFHNIVPPYIVFKTEKYSEKIIIDLAEKVYEILERKEQGYRMELIANLFVLLGKGMDYLRKNSAETRWESRQSEAMRRMLSFIHENYNQPVTIYQVAAAGYVSRSQCYMIFRRFMDKTPIEYLNYYKVMKSTELMRDTSLNLTEISSMCGFSSPSYFSETFVKILDCTPSKYRKSLR